MFPWTVAGVSWVGYVEIEMRTLLLVPLLLSMTATWLLGQTVEDERLQTLRNLTYLVPPTEDLWLTLKDGEHQGHTPTGLAYKDLWLEQVAFGDLNDDGRQDAAIILEYATVMKVFTSLVVVSDVGGDARNVAGTTLSNRNGMNVAVDSLWLESGIVHVEMTRHTEDDANCCPSLHLTNGYVLDEIQSLVELDPDPYEEQVIQILKRLFGFAGRYFEERGSFNGFTERWASNNEYTFDAGRYTIEYPPVEEVSVEVDSGTEEITITAHHACSVWSYVATGYKEFERIGYEGTAPDWRCEEHQ